MLARSRHITLRNSVEFETPLLVPGFSSMAMGPLDYQKTDTKTVPTACSIVHTEILTDAIDEVLLVSAYDIRHSLLTDSGSFNQGFRSSRYSQQRFLIIDSGWYEKEMNSQGALFIDEQRLPLPWDVKSYQEQIDALDSDIKAVIVGFDHSGTYAEQISTAQDFSGHRPGFAFTILLKSPRGSRFHHFERLSREDASNLTAFDVIGVTEKELGDSILKRLETLAGFRSQLDDAQVSAPIHVFGGLDPLFTPLLFAAGAEIFDGLGWLRYAYRDGIPMYREAGALLDNPVDKRWMQALTTIQLQNLDALRNLTSELRVFAHNQGDWSKIRTGHLLKPIFERLDAEMEKNRGR